ncbi:MAG: putative fluoride ion transporter CrcB [Phycisphaerales bacterium]|nr:MAG: putative fluoride ion transporter CrcB [Phycisphaerales bacterium]
MKALLEVVCVALGGALGASLRYGVARGALALWPGHRLSLPMSTLAVNVAGCLMVGLVLPVLLAREHAGGTHHVRLFVVVGLLGALTTFSTFGAETLAFWRDGKPAVALASVALHLLLGLMAVAAGAWLGQRWA